VIAGLVLVVLIGGTTLLGTLVLVDLVRDRIRWRGPGLIMHELICPTGELQDPQYADRRGLPYNDSIVDTTDRTLMGRAPLIVPKTQHSLRHG